VLTGEKIWISLADVADNFLVIAWSDLEKKKQRDPSGMSAFIVERAFKGFSSGTLTHKWGILAGNTGFFKMEDVEVPAENLVGREGEGFKIAMFALDQGRFTVAAGATGLIRACRDASVKYAKERKTFGVEIGEHQLVKELIAQMESDYQAARLLWMRSGSLKNRGVRNTRETGLAKWFATVASERAAGDAVQIHAPTATPTSILSDASIATARVPVIYRARARSTRSCRPITCLATGLTGRHDVSCRPGRHNGHQVRSTLRRPPTRHRSPTPTCRSTSCA
jgi:glutaryl-CoA dehydrogenase (non-decarboxylating)